MSVLEGEQVTVEDTGGREPYILANESVLMRGLVLRSWSNQISIRFRSDQQHNSGFVLLHYQGETVSHYSNTGVSPGAACFSLAMNPECAFVKYLSIISSNTKVSLYETLHLPHLDFTSARDIMKDCLSGSFRFQFQPDTPASPFI